MVITANSEDSIKSSLSENEPPPSGHSRSERRTRYALLYVCPHCGYFGVHMAYESTIQNAKRQGSKKKPLRAFCADYGGSCRPPMTVSEPRRGRGRTQVRLTSMNNDHVIAIVPADKKHRFDPVLSLNRTEDENTRDAAIRAFDSGFYTGAQEPFAFSRWRDFGG